MMKILRAKIRFLLAGVALVIILLLIYLAERSSYQEHVLANPSEGTVTFIVIKNSNFHFPFLRSFLQIDGDPLLECTEGDSNCVEMSILNKAYEYYQIRLSSGLSEQTIEWSDNLSGSILKRPVISTTYELPEASDSILLPSRVYGRVVDTDLDTVAESLVVVRSEGEIVPTLADITGEDGTYTLVYINESDENFPQQFSVYSPDGVKTVYRTASFYNQPVDDIVIPIGSIDRTVALQDNENLMNSCLPDEVIGGIRVRCGDSDQWVLSLDTATCPKEKDYFRVGLVKYTSHTQYHRPEKVILKLYDETSSSYVPDITTGEDLTIRNGGYIYIDKTSLQTGRTYAIHSFDGESECRNGAEMEPTVTINTPKGSSKLTDEQLTYDQKLPPMSKRSDMCSKMGENFSTRFQIPVEQIQLASDLRMRWGEALITDLHEMENYTQSVIIGDDIGMNMILRICHQGNCDVNDGGAYGRAVVSAYRSLKGSGDLPQDGLFVHGGHNEPNSTEYRDPDMEAQFIADLISVLKGADLLSTDPNDIGIKVISPSLDLYVESDGVWPGCTDGCGDPDPHPIRTAQTYITEMLQNSKFATVSDDIFAWAVNDHLDGRGEDNVVLDMQKFSKFISDNDLNNRLIISELSKIDTEMSWRVLGRTINELEEMDNLYIIMLFNSLGSNPDNSYVYHRELWSDMSLISELISNCTAIRSPAPQEGSF